MLQLALAAAALGIAGAAHAGAAHADATPAATAAVAAPADGCLAPHYRLIPLPLRPAAINAAGMIAGTNERHRASLWSAAAGARELPLPGGYDFAEGVAIDAAGRVLAVASDRAAVRYQAYTVDDRGMNLLPGTQTRAYKMALNGTIGGEAQLPGQTNTQPVVWTGGAPHPLGPCCGGAVRDLNRSGAAIGVTYDAAGAFQAFLWTEANGFQLIGPAGRYSSAVAINDRGHVVIQAFPDVYLYDGSRLKRLNLAPKHPSNPQALSNCEVIVGSYGPYSDANRAFAWSPATGFIDLNSLIPPGTGWRLKSAVAISQSGAIVGKGEQQGEDGGFLLLPAAAAAR